MLHATTYESGEFFDAEIRALQRVNVPERLAPLVLYRTGLADLVWSQPSQVGPLLIAASTEGISAITLGTDLASFEERYTERVGRPVRWIDCPPQGLDRHVERALRGERPRVLRFDLRGLSAFEQAVLNTTLRIPRGQVRPYNWIAREIGRPGASRAVGSALAHNPVPLLIPCHRVVRQDGKIGNYLFGSETKRALLELEEAAPRRLEQLAGAGIRYVGSDTTKIFCFPTCHHARRVSDRHLMRFHSETEARSAGYRPCKVCRPAPLAVPLAP